MQIKLKEAENEDTIKVLSGKICESEMVRIFIIRSCDGNIESWIVPFCFLLDYLV